MVDLFRDAGIADPLVVGKKPEARVELANKQADDYATICDLIKALEAQKKAMEARMTSDAVKEVLEQAAETGKRPDSFSFRGDLSSILVTLNRRSSQSPVKDEEVVYFRDANLPLKREVVVPERYYFSEEVMARLLGDEVVREKVSRALQRALGIKNPLKRQAEETITLVTDDTITEAFKTQDPKHLEMLITKAKMIIFKFKPTFDEGKGPETVEDAYEMLQRRMGKTGQPASVVKSKLVDIDAAPAMRAAPASAPTVLPEAIHTETVSETKPGRRKRAKAEK
jgi:hypothetical protein